MSPRVLNGDLAIVSEQVPGRPVVDRHGDEPVPIESAGSISHAGKEDGQVIGLSIKLRVKWRYGFVVQFGSRAASGGIVKVEDGMRAPWSQRKSWRRRCSRYHRWRGFVEFWGLPP